MGDDFDAKVGRRLKARRRLLGMTQQNLADACGVTFQQIHKYECAGNRLSAHMLWKLACALEVDIGYFFDDLIRPPAEPQRVFEAREADAAARLAI
jgi:transcriptional regulator with XRE-family HTH domain